MQPVEECYGNKGAEIGASTIVEFLSTCEKIELDLPIAGFETASGWNLLPFTYPQVKYMNHFVETRHILVYCNLLYFRPVNFVYKVCVIIFSDKRICMKFFIGEIFQLRICLLCVAAVPVYTRWVGRTSITLQSSEHLLGELWSAG